MAAFGVGACGSSDAPVWVLDEPTIAVDAETEEEIFCSVEGGCCWAFGGVGVSSCVDVAWC